MHTIGISSGDPSGIGLEVILKALPQVGDSARWVLFTDAVNFEPHLFRFGSGYPCQWIESPREISSPSVLYLVEVPGPSCPIPWGDVQEAAGARALGYLRAAGEAALRREIDGIVTAP